MTYAFARVVRGLLTDNRSALVVKAIRERASQGWEFVSSVSVEDGDELLIFKKEEGK